MLLGRFPHKTDRPTRILVAESKIRSGRLCELTDFWATYKLAEAPSPMVATLPRSEITICSQLHTDSLTPALGHGNECSQLWARKRHFTAGYGRRGPLAVINIEQTHRTRVCTVGPSFEVQARVSH